MEIENKRDKAEEKLIDGILSNEDFVRVRDRYREDLNKIRNRIDEAENIGEADVETIRKVLMFTRNVYKSYKEAPYTVQRLYLSFFWEGFWIKDRKVVKVKPTSLLETLQKERKIILRSNWLRG